MTNAVLAWVIQHLRKMVDAGETEGKTPEEVINLALHRAKRACGKKRMP